MSSIRIVIASLLAAGAVLSGGAFLSRGALIHHDAPSSISHKVVAAMPEPCCDDIAVR
jgi:hypothetical protein